MVSVGPCVCANNKRIKRKHCKNANPTYHLGFGLLSLIALATTVVVPQHQTEKEATFTQQVMNRFHEVNELYEGTLDEVHHLLYTTDTSSNGSFTFRNTMKQDDKLAFVDAMEKEIRNHEKVGH